MRGSIVKGVGSAYQRGASHVMKIDGHVMLDEGFDVKIMADLQPNWVMVPRRKRLDADNWTLTETQKQDVDYHFLSFPSDPNDFGGPGLNGKVWEARAKERFDKPEYEIDDEMASQGSAWAMFADYFYELELMDEKNYGPFWNESQEIFNKCWLSGGRCVVNKKTWYAHLHKGSKHGRGYRLPESWLQQGASFTKNWIWNEAWPKQTLPFEWLIDHFWPVPTWPENWREVLYATRKPRLVSGVTVPAADVDGGISNGNVTQSVTGLVIISARYGLLLPTETETVDVTERVQSLVKDGSLDIVVNNSTLDTGNVFRGKRKRLWVTYSIDGGEPVTIEREEKDWLIIGPVGQKEPLLKCAGCGRLTPSLMTPDSTTNTGVCSDECADKWIAEHRKPTRDIATVEEVAKQSMTAPALNDHLIRRFQISPQRLRGPMPIELRDFHRNDLAQLFAELGFKRGAEIGVAEGNYSEILMKANPECELLLVDPWHAYSDNPQNKTPDKHKYAYEETLRKIAPYRGASTAMKTSMEAVREIAEKLPDHLLDFCYIDGNHLFDYVMQDLIEWSKRVRSGGIVSGDDYYALDQKRWVGGGVVEAVQAYTNAHRIPIWYLFEGHKSVDFMWVKP